MEEPLADRADARADELEKYAKDPDPQGRIRPPLFTDPNDHGGVDAPGWCLKRARKLRTWASNKRKGFEHKQSQRKRKAWKRRR